MYRSYSLNNMPQPVPEPRHETPTVKEIAEPQKKQSEPTALSRLKSDDMILLVIIALLIFNECNDKLLLLALVYIFFSDYFKE